MHLEPLKPKYLCATWVVVTQNAPKWVKIAVLWVKVPKITGFTVTKFKETVYENSLSPWRHSQNIPEYPE